MLGTYGSSYAKCTSTVGVVGYSQDRVPTSFEVLVTTAPLWGLDHYLNLMMLHLGSDLIFEFYAAQYVHLLPQQSHPNTTDTSVDLLLHVAQAMNLPTNLRSTMMEDWKKKKKKKKKKTNSWNLKI